MTAPITHRVATGVRFLDQHYPDWADRIDIETLDLRRGSACVLGQLGGDYWEERDRLGLTSDDSEALGFTDPIDQQWDELTEEWKRVVRERQPEPEVLEISPTDEPLRRLMDTLRRASWRQ